jgi:translocation and assembly module TamB
MTELDTPQTKRWWTRKRLLLPLLAAGLLFVAFAGLNWLDSPSGQRWVTTKIASQKLKSGLSVHIRKVDGSLFDRARLRTVELHDLNGIFLIIHDADLSWKPGKILRKQLIINDLHIKDAQWLRRPVLNPADPKDPLLPDFDIDIHTLHIDQLRLADAVAGEPFVLTGKGDVHIAARALRTNLVLDAVGTPDHADIRLIAEPERNRFDIDASIKAMRGGVLAKLAGWEPGFVLAVAGKGDYQNWNGKLSASSDAAPLANVMLQMRQGVITANGTVSPHKNLPQNVQSILSAAPQLTAKGSYTRPIADGTIRLAGPASNAAVQGRVNLETSQIMAATAALADSKGAWLQALLPGATATNLAVKATLDGPLRDPDINADVTADSFALAQTRLQKIDANFAGKLGRRTLGTITAKAAQVTTGVASADSYLQAVSATTQMETSDGTLLLRDLRASSRRAQLRGDVLYRFESGGLTATIRSGSANIDTGTFGALPAVFSGAVTRARSNAAYGIAITAAADARNWNIPVELKRAIGNQPKLEGRARLEPDGALIADQLTLTASAGRFIGTGRYFNRKVDARLTGVINNIKAIAPDAPLQSPGPMPISLVLQGPIDDPKINAEVRSDDVTISGVRARNVTLLLAPQDARDWRIGARAQSDFGEVDMSAILRRGALLRLENVQGRIGPASLSGAVQQTAAGLWQGDVRAAVAAGANEKGVLDVQAKLNAANGVQRIDFSADGAGLDRLYKEQRLLADAVRAKGTFILGKTPTLSLNADAKNMRWQDYVINSLSVDGGGALSAARFNYQAAGKRGLPFNAAGVVTTSGARSIEAFAATLDGKIGPQTMKFASPLLVQRTKTGWQLLPAKVQLGRGSIDVSGVAEQNAVDADVVLTAMPLDFIELLRPGFGITGLASGTAKIGLRGDKLVRADGALILKQLRRSSLFQSAPTLELASRFDLGSAGLNISAEAKSAGKTNGNLALLIAADSTGALRNGALRGKLLWDGPVDALSGLSGFDAHDLRGPLRIDADIGGRLRSPDLNGIIQMSGGRYENLALGLTTTDLRIIARFKDSNIAVESATGKLTGGGTLSARGKADLSAERGFPLKLDVTLTKAAILKRDDLDVVASGNLDVVFGGDGGKISGPLKLDRMRLNASTTATPDDIAQVAYRERGAPKTALAAPRRVIAPWELDIAVTAPQNVFVGGLGLISEWGGNFKIISTTQTPSLSGQLQVIRGTYEFAGRRFSIDRGAVNFQAKDRINPVLNISASARINDVTGIITIQGTAQKPSVGFSSSPNLPQDEVMSRILFGTSIDQLSPLEGAQLAGAIAQLSQGNAQKLNVFGTVSKLTRIDRLRVLPANEQIGSGTAISAGKYIGDRLYLEAATDGSGYTATNIEVTLTRALSILSQIATLGGTNVNIKWSKDY